MDTPSPSGTPPHPPLTQPPKATQARRTAPPQALTQVPYEKRKMRPTSRTDVQQDEHTHLPTLTQLPRRVERSEEDAESDIDSTLGERINALCRRQDEMALPPSSPVEVRDDTPTPPERNKPQRENDELVLSTRPKTGEEVPAAQTSQPDDLTASEELWREVVGTSSPVRESVNHGVDVSYMPS